MIRRDSAGTSLVEVVVGMSIFAVVAALAVQAQVAITKGATQTMVRGDRVAAVRLAQLSLEGQVRSAEALVADTTSPTAVAAGCAVLGTSTATSTPASCARVTLPVAAGTRRCVQWQVLPDASATGTALLRTRDWSPTWGTDGDIEAWRTVAKGLATPSASAPPFTVVTAANGKPQLTVQLTAADPDGRLGASAVATTLTPRNLLYVSSTPTACTGAAP